MKIAIICLIFLLGIFNVQAQITQVGSLPVETDWSWNSSAKLTYTYMAKNQDRKEIYVTHYAGIQVIDAETLQLKEKLPMPSIQVTPGGICVDKVSGTIVTLDSRSVEWPTYVGYPVTITVTNPETRIPQNITVHQTARDDPSPYGSCAFSTDGKTLYMGSLDDRDGPTSKKLTALDTSTWKVKNVWVLEKLGINAIMPLPNGRVYLAARYYDTSGQYVRYYRSLWVLGTDGKISKVDFTGYDTTSYSSNLLYPSLGPNGHLYVYQKRITEPMQLTYLLELDPDTDEILSSRTSNRPDIFEWTSANPNYGYMGTDYGNYFFRGFGGWLSLYKFGIDWTNDDVIPFAYGGTDKIYDRAVVRRSDGTDLIAVLRDNRVDLFKAVPPAMPASYIAAVTPLYYGATLNASAQHTPGTVLMSWGANLCNKYPMDQQVPPPNPLKQEMDGCSVHIVDSKGTDLLGSLYYISPGQVNVQLPTSAALGPAQVYVKNGSASTAPVSIMLKSAKPNWVQYAKDGVGYLAALHNSDGALVNNTKPMKSGDAIQIYSVGMGETSPPVPAGEKAVATLTGTVEITVDNKPAQVLWSGLQGQWPGLYQTNFIVPDGITAGSSVTTKVTQSDGTSQNDTFFLEAVQ